ncbi:MAG: radical SAM family heme chaperone HemW [Bacteroidales bacterium]
MNASAPEGLYIHIPFCRQACRYCDFYFTVSLHKADRFVHAVRREMARRREEEPGAGKPTLRSLYLGGGTPSVLSDENLKSIRDEGFLRYDMAPDLEFTLEANPDDLSPDRLSFFRSLGINRLSIGIQSFLESDLTFMRRSHSAKQARQSVEDAARAGFQNISIDLIYGLPGQSAAGWERNLREALSLPVQHISAYHLSFEEGTVFDHWRKKGRIAPVEDEDSLRFYGMLREQLAKAGFEHYEISNFARSGYPSRHNQLYWSGRPYQAVGPSAHAFDGRRRSWNVSSLEAYLEGVEQGKPVREQEDLTVEERYHDRLITTLRTSRGIDVADIHADFGPAWRDHFLSESARFLEEGMLKEDGGTIRMAPEHWLETDRVLRGLF